MTKECNIGISVFEAMNKIRVKMKETGDCNASIIDEKSGLEIYLDGPMNSPSEFWVPFAHNEDFSEVWGPDCSEDEDVIEATQWLYAGSM